MVGYSYHFWHGGMKNEVAKKQAAQVQEKEKSNMAKEVVAPQVKEKEAIAKKEAGEKLPNTASNNVAMMGLSACLVALGTLFGLNRRNKVKA